MARERLIKFLNKNSLKMLWLAIIGYTLIFSLISFWKYSNYLYNGLDLAILNQTFYNTSLGRWYELSIHPPTYLADHFKPMILFISPIYALWRDPRMLLLLQSLILALASWPVYLITKEVFNKYQLKNIYALIAGLLFLSNPLVQNINVFEYHMLPWAIFSLLFAFYFYQKRRFGLFLVFIILSLLIREDIGLIVAMFGPLYLIDSFKNQGNFKLTGKDWLWFLVPLLLGLTWLLAALKIIAFFNSDGHYKFLYYYSWLGNSLGEIVFGPFRHPLKVLLHLATLGNLEMILGFLFSFLFLPLFSVGHLVLALATFYQMTMGASGGSEIILHTHYSALFLPALVISSIYGAKKFIEKRSAMIKEINYKIDKPSVLNYFKITFKIIVAEKNLLLIIVITAVIFFNLALGPLLSAVVEIAKKDQAQEKIISDTLLSQIPPTASLVTSYGFLSNTSSRQNIYALNYVFIGKKQMSRQPYNLPKKIDWAVIDFDDFLAFQLQYKKMKEFDIDYSKGDSNVRDFLKNKNLGLVEIYDDIAIFKSGFPDSINLFVVNQLKNDFAKAIALNEEIIFLGSSTPKAIERVMARQKLKFLEVTFSWQAKNKMEKNYQLQFSIENERGKIIYEKIYPLAYGLYPTSDWQKGETIATTYRFLLPKIKGGNPTAWLSVVEVDGKVRLNGIRSIFKDYEVKKPVGQKIFLTSLN